MIIIKNKQLNFNKYNYIKKVLKIEFFIDRFFIKLKKNFKYIYFKILINNYF